MQVPDPVFADRLVGDGVAIEPLENKIYAPITGVVKSIHRSKHAITFCSSLGFDVLVHIGLDTVHLNGDGFSINITEGERVTQGEVIGEFDLDYVAKRAKALISPIVLVDLDQSKFSFKLLPQTKSKCNSPIIQLMAKSSLIEQNNTSNNNNSNNLKQSDAIIVKNMYGIHARPAAIISTIANSYGSDIIIEKGGNKVNAKSIISILGLAVAKNDTIYIYANSSEIINKIKNAIDNLANNDEESYVSLSQSSNLIVGSRYYGIAASVGIVSGNLAKRSEVGFVIEENASDTNLEKNRFYNSINAVKHDIEYSISHLENNVLYRDILNAHLVILSDPDMISSCLDTINHGKTAAYAVSLTCQNICKTLANSGSALLVERQSDLKDLRNRILNMIEGVEARALKFDTPTILLADEISPADLMQLDKNVVGLVSVTGGPTSHVAIIARSRSIPLLVGVDSSILDVADGGLAILNTRNNYIDLSPDSQEIALVDEQLAAIKYQHELDIKNSNLDAVTMDGYTVDCLANITHISEADKILTSGAGGVGLFRTEFIFFDRESAPNEEEQFNIYKKIADGLKDNPFIIRSFDAGGEKPIKYLNLPHETNPVLGVRGIRLCLEYKDLFMNQLRAILTLCKPNVKIMLPMVTNIEEYRQVRDIILQLKEQLKINTTLQLGIMVEVPSVAILSDAFAKEVDFFSIGTNDLTQYILAMDREHTKLASQIDHLHPAVIRTINIVVENAKVYNKPVSICGLMASEKWAIPVLIGLGINSLSMNLNAIAENKAFIRTLKYEQCVIAAKECMGFATSAEVRNYLRNSFSHVHI